MNSDKRIETNFKYHAPTEEDITKYQEIRDSAKSMAYLIMSQCPYSREFDLAMTKLEEMVMWANASIARNSKSKIRKIGRNSNE